MTSSPHDDSARPGRGEEPRFGQRVPDEVWEEFLAVERRERAGASSPEVDPSVRARALRRMVGGLSFALCMLGILVVVGLMALDAPWWSLLGALPLLAGFAGVIAVRWRIPRAFRDAEGPRRPRRANRWFWWPVGLAVLGGAALAVSFSVPQIMAGAEPLVQRSYVVLWSEIGLVLLLNSALMAGLIALALWTVPDEDDAILRSTDYAERLRNRGGGNHYDSDWIRGRNRRDR